MVIDFHTHTFPESIADRALSKLRSLCHTRTFSDGTVDSLRSTADEAGIDFSVVLPVATGARQDAHINDSVLRAHEAEEADPRGVISFGAVHPDDPDWKSELTRLARAGVRGIKIHPPYQEVPLDDPRYLRILNAAGELGLIVVTHAGLDVGLPGHEESTVEKIASAVRQAGPVRLVCAHMGGWRCWREVCDLLPDTGVMLDTSFSLGRLAPTEDGYPWTEEGLNMLSPEDFCGIVNLFGADRILFGTDSPWTDRKAEVEAIRRLPLSEEQKDLILGENARRLLGLS